MNSALILVGGRASRADGFPKHQFRCGDKTFLEIQVKELASCADDIHIVCRNATQKEDIPHFKNVSYIQDIREGRGPAGGIHSGAWHASGAYFFVTACDMPFLSCKVVTFLFKQAEGFDAAVPIWEDGKFEPLCAVYQRDAVRKYYEQNETRRLSSLVQGINTHYIPVNEIRSIDSDLKIFCNVNDFASLEQIKKVIPG